MQTIGLANHRFRNARSLMDRSEAPSNYTIAKCSNMRSWESSDELCFRCMKVWFQKSFPDHDMQIFLLGLLVSSIENLVSAASW